MRDCVFHGFCPPCMYMYNIRNVFHAAIAKVINSRIVLI